MSALTAQAAQAAQAAPAARTIVSLLDDLYTSPADILAWLGTPQPLLCGRVPWQLIETGHAQDVRRALEQIRDGAYP